MALKKEIRTIKDKIKDVENDGTLKHPEMLNDYKELYNTVQQMKRKIKLLENRYEADKNMCSLLPKSAVPKPQKKKTSVAGGRLLKGHLPRKTHTSKSPF